MFERLVQTEFPMIQSGVKARTFFDEGNALRWLAWQTH
jgi:hypothetical protein